MEQNDWNADKLLQVLEDEQRSKSMMPDVDEAILLDELRLRGIYIALKSKAERKRELDQASCSSQDIKPAQLLSWYFESQLGEPVPAGLDKYLATIGINRRQDFYRLLESHYRFVLAIEPQNQ